MESTGDANPMVPVNPSVSLTKSLQDSIHPPGPTAPTRWRIAIAGASGFVGSSIRSRLSDSYDWIGLTRSEPRDSSPTSPNAAPVPHADRTEWRQCDLFSLGSVSRAIEGADCAIYLVHSMLPSSRLVQGSFRDMDLLLADNFVRAAERAGIRRIIYLGGLIPEGTESLSPHLASRLEVEKVLGSRSIPLTVLRAGIIFGPGGSSMRMLVNLVQRLPVMILPAWTKSKTHSIDVRDVVRAIEIILESPESWNGTYDIGGHRAMTYKQMIMSTARVLGSKRLAVSVPVSWVPVSRLWVKTVSGSPGQLVKPLLESLRHNLVARRNPLMDQIQPGAISFEDSIREAVDDVKKPLPAPGARERTRHQSSIRDQRRVRSVQRMPLPPGWNADRVAAEYGTWLPRKFGPLLAVTRDDRGVLRFLWTWPRRVLLELTPSTESEPGDRRRVFRISGGALVRRVQSAGRFEFRIFPETNVVIAAIHGFAPRLPWRVYQASQALIHLAVMHAFSRHLGTIRRKALHSSSMDPSRNPPV